MPADFQEGGGGCQVGTGGVVRKEQVDGSEDVNEAAGQSILVAAVQGEGARGKSAGVRARCEQIGRSKKKESGQLLPSRNMNCCNILSLVTGVNLWCKSWTEWSATRHAMAGKNKLRHSRFVTHSCKSVQGSAQIRHASAASFFRRMRLQPPSRLSHEVLRFEALSCAMSGRSMWVGWQAGAATFVARCFRYAAGCG